MIKINYYYYSILSVKVFFFLFTVYSSLQYHNNVTHSPHRIWHHTLFNFLSRLIIGLPPKVYTVPTGAYIIQHDISRPPPRFRKIYSIALTWPVPPASDYQAERGDEYPAPST